MLGASSGKAFARRVYERPQLSLFGLTQHTGHRVAQPPQDAPSILLALRMNNNNESFSARQAPRPCRLYVPCDPPNVPVPPFLPSFSTTFPPTFSPFLLHHHIHTSYHPHFHIHIHTQQEQRAPWRRIRKRSSSRLRNRRRRLSLIRLSLSGLAMRCVVILFHCFWFRMRAPEWSMQRMLLSRRVARVKMRFAHDVFNDEHHLAVEIITRA